MFPRDQPMIDIEIDSSDYHPTKFGITPQNIPKTFLFP